MPAEENKRSKRSYSWLELYEAKTSDQPIRTTSERPRGRPPRVLAAKKRSVYLTSGEEEAINRWQSIFSELFGRKVALGETAGILARICADRFDILSDGESTGEHAGIDRSAGRGRERPEAEPVQGPRGIRWVLLDPLIRVLFGDFYSVDLMYPIIRI